MRRDAAAGGADAAADADGDAAALRADSAATLALDSSAVRRNAAAAGMFLVVLVEDFDGGDDNFIGRKGWRSEGTSTEEQRKEEREEGAWKESGVEE
ncbi:hypothetical protein PRIPAC_86094 [Pristionchus pacificus]|uniref:Uncharacterized protein n=1 Tax=Pristionchus pacificus TaxID=54126 RepID=A0A2A6BLM4_PRIPA|nr:hypothetical protein PRIPAC_86094 [Pristionchus pacificus]|eukprot:PDM66797.1 hypothetical protein PRIPAC_48214 [Pristionchus pacificus]